MNKKNIPVILVLSLFFTVSLIYAADQNFLQNFLNILKNISSPATKTQETKHSLFLNPAPTVFDLESAVTQIAEKSSSAVVSIIISKYVPIVERYYVNPFYEFDLPPEIQPFFNFQFQVPQYRQKGYQEQKVGGGTGFIISSDGLILTNKHVVSDPKAEYTVYLNDGRKFKTEVLALHPNDDLALIKISANNLPTLILGDSDKVKLGQFVVAIGNALAEFQNTVSFGVISGLKRAITASDESGNIERLEGLIQTDAAINFGNSGGPLINLKGEVIAVNTAIAGGADNIGFAIPVNRAKKMIEQYKAKGKIEVPFLGVYYLLINEEVKNKFKLSVDYGAYIYHKDQNLSAIIPNSPAELYGLRDKDIILEMDGEKITSQNSLSQIIMKKSVGQKILLKVLRGNQTLDIYVILGSLPKNLQ
jgi:S1-C subfamily serine protease